VQISILFHKNMTAIMCDLCKRQTAKDECVHCGSNVCDNCCQKRLDCDCEQCEVFCKQRNCVRFSHKCEKCKKVMCDVNWRTRCAECREDMLLCHDCVFACVLCHSPFCLSHPTRRIKSRSGSHFVDICESCFKESGRKQPEKKKRKTK